MANQVACDLWPGGEKQLKVTTNTLKRRQVCFPHAVSACKEASCPAGQHTQHSQHRAQQVYKFACSSVRGRMLSHPSVSTHRLFEGSARFTRTLRTELNSAVAGAAEAARVMSCGGEVIPCSIRPSAYPPCRGQQAPVST